MSAFTLHPLDISDAAAVSLTPHCDARGRFTKIFATSAFPPLARPWAECYLSTSVPGVIRGMHLQAPPHQHDKLVVCIEGTVLDVVLDLRADSPTNGRYASIRLGDGAHQGMFVPAGCAHGFCVIGDRPATLLYLVTSEHVPASDIGVRWDSFGMQWPVNSPVMSARDASLPPLSEFRPQCTPQPS